MPKVAIDRPAPEFRLQDYRGEWVSLADYRGRQHVLLIFNRGFT